MTTETTYWRNGQWIGTLFVGAVFSLIPLGVFLAIYLDDPTWLTLCGALIFFLS